MNTEQQKVLDEMIKENNTTDNTSYIQSVKHSNKIRKDVSNIQNIKRKLKTNDFKTLDKEASSKCGFLFLNYPNIYNKLLKDEIDINTLYQFLVELEEIEKGNQNQHEASYKIGTLLKKLYSDKRIKDEKPEKKKETKPVHKISYDEFKKKYSNNL